VGNTSGFHPEESSSSLDTRSSFYYNSVVKFSIIHNVIEIMNIVYDLRYEILNDNNLTLPNICGRKVQYGSSSYKHIKKR